MTITSKIIMHTIAFGAGLGGAYLVWIHGHLYVALGVILMIFGNNLSNKTERKSSFRSNHGRKWQL
jgi:hypothetical protein